MHEMTIAAEIMEIARASIPSHMPGVVIVRIHLKIGKFSTVIPENLRYCFTMAVHGTDLAATRLQIEEIPLVTRCAECLFVDSPQEPNFLCKRCNSPRLDIISGREMELVSIEIDDNMEFA